MNKSNVGAHKSGEDRAIGGCAEASSPMPEGQRVGNYDGRLAELEIENFRLQRLVAELLIKNQQLRKSD